VLRALRSDRRLAAALEPIQVLYWLYAGRLVISVGVFGSALLVADWLRRSGVPTAGADRQLAVIVLAGATVLTPLAYAISHRRRRRPTALFLWTQAGLDLIIVNAVVHLTGGSQSPFVSIFIAIAAAYGLILSLPAAVTVALGAGLVYLADQLVFFPGQVGASYLLLQVVVFTLVALATSLIASRLRIVRDELRVVEGELRRLQIDTADVLRIISSGVVTVDSEGRLVYMNLAAAELLDVAVTEALGTEFAPVLERRSPALAGLLDETVRRGRRIRNREVEILPSAHPAGDDAAEGGSGDRDGRDFSPIPVAVSSSTLQGAGAERSYVLLLQDLRPVRQLEDLRLRAGRLGAVAELSASLAHELKNPLASIRSAVEQLSEGSFEEEDDRLLARLIVRESDRLDTILKEFNDFARVDVAERRPLDLERLFRQVVETAERHPAAAGRARFEIEVQEDMGGLWGDPELLHRTLLNLVLNAVQVGDGSRPVHVRIVADALRPDLVPGEISLGSPVRVRVIDDGPGIDPEDLPRIFDPFYTRRPGGSGLGLSIAHRAVQAHGGALLATSRPGEGATFVMVLPRRASRRCPPPSEERRESGPLELEENAEVSAVEGIPDGTGAATEAG
jgi:two-component system sensor histidine kinase PilS (NtrC family)